MKNKGYVYLLYALLLIPGILIGYRLKANYGVSLTLGIHIGVGCDITPQAILLLYVSLMRLPLLLFASGFTLYAPLVAGGSVLYLGIAIGSYPVFPERSPAFVAVLLLLALAMALFLVLCGQASLHRMHLKRTAPHLGALLRYPPTRAYLQGFLAHCAVTLGISVALVWLLSQM